MRVCFDCGSARSDGSECPNHPGEPLLDPHDPEVRAEMKKTDAWERQKKYGFWSTAGVLVGFGYATPICYAWFEGVEISDRVFGIMVFALASPAMLLGYYLGRRFFRPRFAQWTRGSQ